MLRSRQWGRLSPAETEDSYAFVLLAAMESQN
jgi:hypothetical protein